MIRKKFSASEFCLAQGLDSQISTFFSSDFFSFVPISREHIFEITLRFSLLREEFKLSVLPLTALALISSTKIARKSIQKIICFGRVWLSFGCFERIERNLNVLIAVAPKEV